MDETMYASHIDSLVEQESEATYPLPHCGLLFPFGSESESVYFSFLPDGAGPVNFMVPSIPKTLTRNAA
jgi:hypothetical protein